MHLRELDDRAAGGNEPMKPLRLRKLADRSAVLPSFANLLDASQVSLDQIRVEFGRQRRQSAAIERDPGAKKSRARQYKTIPALMRSPRSTRGTTRMIE